MDPTFRRPGQASRRKAGEGRLAAAAPRDEGVAEDATTPHGTRVRIVATCTSCGEERELRRAPRGAFVCAACGGDDIEVHPGGDVEFACAACGRKAWRPGSVPAAARPLCPQCAMGVERADRGRIEGETLDTQSGVRRKRRPPRA
jgi:predicted RNA-binding Zn-ribbon protein involved in translation (DUF1610 family)